MFGVAEFGCGLGHLSTRTTKLYDRTYSVQPTSRLPSRLTGPQIRDLSGHALPVGRHPRIAVNHGFILHRNCATKKPNPFKALFWVRNS